jgi:hypothetical protein
MQPHSAGDDEGDLSVAEGVKSQQLSASEGDDTGQRNSKAEVCLGDTRGMGGNQVTKIRQRKRRPFLISSLPIIQPDFPLLLDFPAMIWV